MVVLWQFSVALRAPILIEAFHLASAGWHSRLKVNQPHPSASSDLGDKHPSTERRESSAPPRYRATARVELGYASSITRNPVVYEQS